MKGHYLPENWIVEKSQVYCAKVADGTHDTPKQVPEGKILVTSKNIKNGKVNFDGCYLISENDYSQINKRSKVDKGDVLFSMIGTVGEIAFVDEDPSYAIKNIGLFKTKSYLDGKWLYCYLTSKIGQAALDTFLTGTSQQFVSLGDLRKVPVIRAPQNIQRKIAAVLTAYDDLIENNNRRIAILEKMAEELYREWFVRLRFPGHKKVKIVKGVPEGWEGKTVEQSFEYLGGGTPSTLVNNYWQGGDINWYSPTDLTAADALFSFQSKAQITELGLKESSARLFPPYSIMMTSRATIGQISINTTPACTNQGFITCIPNDKVPLYFLYYWLKLNKEYFIQIANGATFLELTKGKFKNVNILIPPARIVESYTKVQRPIFEILEILLRQKEYLITSRDRLLSRLMSGKIDVENLDIQFPDSMKEEAANA